MEELKELSSKPLDWMERYTELSLQVRKLIEMANDPEASDEDIVDWINRSQELRSNLKTRDQK